MGEAVMRYAALNYGIGVQDLGYGRIGIGLACYPIPGNGR
jgi:hypothetical protein